MYKFIKYFSCCLFLIVVSCKPIQLRNDINNYYQKYYSKKSYKASLKFRKKAITTFLNAYSHLDIPEFVMIEAYEPNVHSPALGMDYRAYFVIYGKVIKCYLWGEKEKFEEDFSFRFVDERLYNYEEIIYSKLIKGEESDLIEYHDKDEGGLSVRAFMYATRVDSNFKIINGVTFIEFNFDKELYEKKILNK